MKCQKEKKYSQKEHCVGWAYVYLSSRGNHQFKATLGDTVIPWRKRKGGRNGGRKERGGGVKARECGG